MQNSNRDSASVDELSKFAKLWLKILCQYDTPFLVWSTKSKNVTLSLHKVDNTTTQWQIKHVIQLHNDT